MNVNGANGNQDSNGVAGNSGDYDNGENGYAAGGKGKTPARYRLYDGIKEKVSLRAMDIVIYIIIGLIALALLAGIISKKRVL